MRSRSVAQQPGGVWIIRLTLLPTPVRRPSRGMVFVDGEVRQPNTISVTADGVAVQFLTVHNALINGLSGSACAAIGPATSPRRTGGQVSDHGADLVGFGCLQLLEDRQGLEPMRPGLLEPAERPQSPTKLPQALSLAARVAQLPAERQTLPQTGQR